MLKNAPLVLGVIVLIGSILYWIGNDKFIAHEEFSDYSVFNTDSLGMSLAYRYLDKKYPSKSVNVLDRTIRSNIVESDAVVFRVHPDTEFTSTKSTAPENIELRDFINKLRELFGSYAPEDDSSVLTPSERKWVNAGGRLILAIKSNYGPIRIDTIKPKKWEKVYPIFPGVDKLRPPVSRSIDERVLSKMHAVFAHRDKVILARKVMGEGEVYVIACPEIFSNNYIVRTENLKLLESLVGETEYVYFDENVHDMVGSVGVLDLIVIYGYKSALFILCLVLALIFWRVKIRLGPPVDDYREKRIESIDFVESLALLYNRALKRSELISLYQKVLLREVKIRTQLRGEALNKKITELSDSKMNVRGIEKLQDESSNAQKKDKLSKQEFILALRITNSAFRRLNRK